MRLPASTALGIRWAAECFLDRAKLGDALKSLAGNRGWHRSSIFTNWRRRYDQQTASLPDRASARVSRVMVL
ncbi:hypothetical protein J2R96_002109 [Bradyrhizobium elkanii]|nr:hypothetical protein [Bradyrhizobium elkanii]